MKKFLLLGLALLGLTTITGLPARAFDAGSGTPTDPYQINGWRDLDSIKSDPSATSSYKLMVDLDSDTPDYDNYGNAWTPLGNTTTPFMGNFDGNGHNINDLIIDMRESNYVGLFGKTGDQAIIRALGMEDASVLGQEFVGILAGENGGLISQCYTAGQVSGRNRVGGLSGGNASTGYIYNSYSTAAASGYQTGWADIGGLVGGQGGSEIINSYATGAVSGDSNYAIHLGGLLGTNHDGLVVSSFWDVETSGRPSSSQDIGTYGVGITSSQMSNQATFSDVNWDFINIWEMSGGRPHLQWENINTGYEGPTEIYNCQQLQAIRLGLSGKYSLVKDIDCYNDTRVGGKLDNSGAGFQPIGDDTEAFSGIFSGNGYKIDGLYINRPEQDLVGLFGNISNQATINNVGLINADITGNRFTGILAGKSQANIFESYSMGVVAGDSVGGLIGVNEGQLSDSYSMATTTGSSIAGGLVGENAGGVDNSYSTGQVFGSGSIGGLIATTIAIKAATVNDSFWDTESSGVLSSAGGVGITTNQIKASSTLTNAGWDMDNTWGIDGSPEKNDGYPYLLWQAPYVIEYLAEGNGSIEGPVVQRVGADINPEPVEAVPAVNYKFDSWSDGNENPERSDGEIYGNFVIIANFVPDPNAVFTLTYSAGLGGIIIGSSSQSVVYNSDGSAVSASPNSGYRFVRWSDNSTDNPRTDTDINQNITVSAIFERIPSSGGSSSSLPAGIGAGAVDKIIGMGQTSDIGIIDDRGVNCLGYVGSKALFKILSAGRAQDHQLTIDNLDLNSKEVGLTIQSDPLIAKLKLGEIKYFDLDNDKADDLMIKFTNLDVNRIELTIKAQQLASTTIVTAPAEKTVDEQPVIIVTKPTTTIAPAKPKAVKYSFQQNLFFGLARTEVKELQKFLNLQGYLVAKTGPGSIGRETAFFGQLTKAALAKFQKANNIQPATGFFGPITRKLINGLK